MAAPTTCTSSSSEEEEEEALVARLREAAWDPARPAESEAALLSPAAGSSRERKVPAAESSSIRTKIYDHSQDGNELQTTPEFRAHVAKKLEAILDSSITTLECRLQTTQKNLDVSEMDNDGFRLFSSSIPEDCGRPESLPRGRRCPRNSSSSSSSDQEWQKFQESAVSGAEILKQSSLSRGLRGSREDPSCRIDETGGKKAKKKRKRKKKEEVVEVEGEESGGQVAIESTCSTLNGTCKRDATTEMKGTVKKRKRKKRRRREEEPGWKDDSTATLCQ